MLNMRGTDSEFDSFVIADQSSESDGMLTITRNVKRKRVCLTNEVKKLGVLIDRGQHMEFRPEDILIIYVSMGGFEK